MTGQRRSPGVLYPFSLKQYRELQATFVRIAKKGDGEELFKGH